MEKIKILYGLGCYWPGHERYGASGPIQSLEALVSALGDEYEFKVLAHDQEPGSRERFIKPEEENCWVQKDHLQVCYVQGGMSGRSQIARIINETEYDLIVLNGFFDQGITLPILFLNYFKQIPNKPIILSPRGEFSPGAFALKVTKKKLYLLFNKVLGITKNIILHATTKNEADLFQDHRLPCKRIDVAHVVSKYFERPIIQNQTETEILKLVFVSRVSEKKNLDGALNILKMVKSNVQYDIYGPIENQNYWAQCEELIRELPHNVQVNYKGLIANQHVPETISQYDLLFLPTHGENFGHVMHEAFMSGLPCLISDQTPWRHLEQEQAGWDLSLEKPEVFASTIEKVAVMSSSQRAQLKNSARAYGEKQWHKQKAIDETRRMYACSMNKSVAKS